MRKSGLLAWCATLLTLTAVAQATDDWPDPESIVGVSVLVFEHAAAPAKTRAQEGLTQFPDAIGLPDLAESEGAFNNRPRDRRQHRADDRPPMVWSMQNWLGFIHSGVLSQLPQPLTGPPLPPRPQQPLLNAPLLLRQSAVLPSELEAMVSRLRSSAAHTPLVVAHWYQVLEVQSQSPQIAVGPSSPSQSQRIPWLSLAWWADTTHQPEQTQRVTGYVELTQSQFLRANIEIWLHEAVDQQIGPLRRSHLYPTGFWVAHLKANRSIEPNRWVYFDSETLGVLIKVSPR